MVEVLVGLAGYRFLMVGENRSPMAIRSGWSWQTCQKSGPRLCAIQLFGALENIGLDLRNTENVTFVNVWGDNGEVNLFVVPEGRVVVAMGKKVGAELEKRGIAPDLQIPHPAARGKIRNPEVYCQTVWGIFNNWLSSQTALGV